MKFNDSHEEMSPQEQHGIQLRLVTDELENRTFDYSFEAITAVLAAEVNTDRNPTEIGRFGRYAA